MDTLNSYKVPDMPYKHSGMKLTPQSYKTSLVDYSEYVQQAKARQTARKERRMAEEAKRVELERAERRQRYERIAYNAVLVVACLATMVYIAWRML